MSLKTELSDENVYSYADSCINLAVDMPAKKVDTIIIPSRGAVPVFLGMIEALNLFAKDDANSKKFLDNLRIGKLVKKYLPHTIGLSIDNYLLDWGHEHVDVLFLPFTADLNMEEYSKSANSDYYANNMRRFWPKVISALSKGQKERVKDPYLNFVNFINTELEERPELGNELFASKWIEKKNFAIIDTVISGRAYSTILEGFKDLKVGTPSSFLIVDENGRKLKEKYSVKLGLRKANECQVAIEVPENKISAYYINRIFSEDRGSALEGLVGVVYPSLMVHAEKDPEIKKNFGTLACGSWYSIPEGFPHKEAFDYFNAMLKAAIMIKCGDKDYLKSMEENREKFVDVVSTNHLLEPGSKESINCLEYKKYSPTKVYETGSHVLHVCFSDADSVNILNRFKRFYDSKTKDVFSTVTR